MNEEFELMKKLYEEFKRLPAHEFDKNKKELLLGVTDKSAFIEVLQIIEGKTHFDENTYI